MDRDHLPVEFALEQIFELLGSQASITDDCRHRIGIDWIVAWNDDSQWAFGHEHMLPCRSIWKPENASETHALPSSPAL
jgi:hypothetical protein